MNGLSETRVVVWAQKPLYLVSMENALTRLRCEVRRARSFTQLGQWVKSHSVDLVVTWLSTDDQDALDLVTWLDEIPGAPAVLVVVGGLDMELYLEAMRRGAFDCIGLPVDENELARIIGSAVELSHDRQFA
jgi:DNA-binding NtrC family response regulator